MIGITFNFDIFDDPYNQSKVKQGFKKLEDIAINLEDELFLSFGKKRSTLFESAHDDYIVVQHSTHFYQDTKKEIADIIKGILTIKKIEYKNKQMTKCLIVFEHMIIMIVLFFKAKQFFYIKIKKLKINFIKTYY